MTEPELLKLAATLRIHGLAAHWDSLRKDPAAIAFAKTFLEWENEERQQRSLARYVKSNGIVDMEPMANFDWDWPKKIDRGQIEELFTLDFLAERANVVMVGSAGIGKTMIAKNLVDHASRRGQAALFVESSRLMADLVSETTRRGLEQALVRYTKPKLLAIDELGYLSYDARFADLLFQLIHRRTKQASTIITTNRSFAEWPSVFPNAASVTALVDRVIERCEVVHIEGESYRGKRFAERMASRAQRQKKTKAKG